MIYTGDCLDILPGLDAGSVDAIVTDPPYGLSFMGKAWDNAVPSVVVWRECLRVLKPGGHLLCFAGTRTQHRMATGIEDAGFEIRDMIAWVYGSGFPKSLNVSKAIDKTNGETGRLLKFTRWMRTTGATRKSVTDAMIANGHISANGTMAGHYFAETESGQPAIPTPAIWETVRPLCGNVPAWVDELVERIEAEREVVGKDKNWGERGNVPVSGYGEFNITAPATPEAQQWDGWGTALKPALEPITVARKPFKGTVAANVLEHGTGALNVDGCRVGTEEELGRNNNTNPYGSARTWSVSKTPPQNNVGTAPQGRFPANLIHDGSDEVVRGMGQASRYFYCAKASKADRDEGCEGMEAKDKYGPAGRWNSHDCFSGKSGDDAWKAKNPNLPKGNPHPTVKPTALMRYLVRLVTPPGGTVLDPFMGSGSTGKAAVLEGFEFIGIEIDPDYVAIAEARMKHAGQQP